MNNLFGADGIRGSLGKCPLQPEGAEKLGRAIAAKMRQDFCTPEFLLGSDTRESSQRLKKALSDGLTRGGIRVLDAGILPTSSLSFLIAIKGTFAGGAIVTASHNPVTENGIKIFDYRGVKIDDQAEALIERLFLGIDCLPFESRPAANTYEPDYVEQYIYALAQEQQNEPIFKRRVVLDCANGAAYQVAPAILDKLGLSYILINANPDGTNINNKAGSEHVRLDPKAFSQEIRKWNANIGIAFDGDADRVVFVDREGHFYDGDFLLATLALKLQREHRLNHQGIVITPLSNEGLIRYVKQHQIQVFTVKNGDKYITETLLKQNLTLGGEEIGHIIVHTDATRVTGDGLRTALLILAELSRYKDMEIYELAPGLCKWPQIKASVWLGRNMNQPTESIPGLPELIQEVRQAVPDLYRLECRPASTETVYRIVIEARTTSTIALSQHAFTLAQHIQHYYGCSDKPVQVLDCVKGGCL